MKNLKCLFFVAFVFAFLSVSPLVRADSTFSFGTDPQSVAVSQTSGLITIHSDAKVTETTYLDFTSSSPTGQFLTSTNKSLTSSYISTGDSNRSVYYQDSTAGDFVITVAISNKAKVPITTISQHIYIGQSVPGGSSGSTASTTDTTPDASGQTTQSDNSNSSIGTNISSANSSPASVSNDEAPIDFQISAGRDRLTSVGNSLLFIVMPVQTKGISNTVSYNWSFGDGGVGMGDNVNHTYKFPGEYSVVVNATASDQMAVDRLVVKVIDPQIAMQKIDGGVEVANNSSVEINLEGWVLVSSNKTFIFPKDTLLPAGRKVVFADDVTMINSGDLQIKNPLGKTYASVLNQTPQPNVVLTIPISTKSLDDISVSVSDVSEKLALLQKEINISDAEVAVTLSASPNITVANTTSTGTDSSSSTSTPESQTAVVFLASSSPSLISHIFAWPIAGFNFIRGLFVEK